MELKSRLDLTEIFCDVDDFHQNFERYCRSIPQLTTITGEKRCRSRMSISEVMTIVIAFHGSGYKTFKEFYTLQVKPHWQKAFPTLVSYSRASSMLPELRSGHASRLCRVNALVDDVTVLFSTN